MKMVRDTTGRFKERPHYEPKELDRECEAIIQTFLKKRYGAIRYPVSTGDLTVLIEAETEDLDHYADLDGYGKGVEGVTIFQPGAKPIVKISAALSDDNRENRHRTTLTHEYGHVKFHAYLFDQAAGSRDLFETEHAPEDRIQVCKRDTILEARNSDWMEWQAGHVCGAILMPANAVRSMIKEKFPAIADGEQLVDKDTAAAMIEQVQGDFQVSKDAARVRLLRLQVLPESLTSRNLF